jgi:hypothetical protein
MIKQVETNSESYCFFSATYLLLFDSIPPDVVLPSCILTIWYLTQLIHGTLPTSLLLPPQVHQIHRPNNPLHDR